MEGRARWRGTHSSAATAPLPFQGGDGKRGRTAFLEDGLVAVVALPLNRPVGAEVLEEGVQPVQVLPVRRCPRIATALSTQRPALMASLWWRWYTYSHMKVHSSSPSALKSPR